MGWYRLVEWWWGGIELDLKEMLLEYFIFNIFFNDVEEGIFLRK